MQNLGPARALLNPSLRFDETCTVSVPEEHCLGLPVPLNPFLPFGPGPPLAAPMAELGGTKI